MRSTLIMAAALIFAAVSFAGCSTAPTRKTDAPTVVTEKGVSEVSPDRALPGVEAAYSQFVDVRSADEYAAGHAYRARNIPFDQLANNLDKLERNEPVYLICNTGNTSKKAAQQLVDAGFTQAISISGGMAAWRAAGLPVSDNTSKN